jgi:hypothetical protein
MGRAASTEHVDVCRWASEGQTGVTARVPTHMRTGIDMTVTGARGSVMGTAALQGRVEARRRRLGGSASPRPGPPYICGRGQV